MRQVPIRRSKWLVGSEFIHTHVFKKRAKPCWEPWKSLSSDNFDEMMCHYLLPNAQQTVEALPIEFYAHQLLAVDYKNVDELIEFCAQWGIPLHPSRYGHTLQATKRTVLNARKETDLIASAKTPGAVSLSEVSLAICDLQSCVQKLFLYVAGKSETCDLDLINIAARNSLYIGDRGFLPFDVGYEPRFGITNAICAQIVDTCLSKADWKICACDDCEIPFKNKQTKTVPKTEQKRSRGSKYCCDRCEERQSTINKSKAAKNRIKH